MNFNRKVSGKAPIELTRQFGKLMNGRTVELIDICRVQNPTASLDLLAFR
ncbi:MAG: hypothetical protein MI866_10850 [Bacteroidales bacterium]|nr:hypothetical protein [Bacteroidales bacterium]